MSGDWMANTRTHTHARTYVYGQRKKERRTNICVIASDIIFWPSCRHTNTPPSGRRLPTWQVNGVDIARFVHRRTTHDTCKRRELLFELVVSRSLARSLQIDSILHYNRLHSRRPTSSLLLSLEGRCFFAVFVVVRGQERVEHARAWRRLVRLVTHRWRPSSSFHLLSTVPSIGAVSVASGLPSANDNPLCVAVTDTLARSLYSVVQWSPYGTGVCLFGWRSSSRWLEGQCNGQIIVSDHRPPCVALVSN